MFKRQGSTDCWLSVVFPSIPSPPLSVNSKATVCKLTCLELLFLLFSGKKLADSKDLAGAGRLTLARVDTMQNFYGRAIRDNKGNAKEMSKATKAILQHYSSTVDRPRHDDCPAGPYSWCSYQ